MLIDSGQKCPKASVAVLLIFTWCDILQRDSALKTLLYHIYMLDSPALFLLCQIGGECNSFSINLTPLFDLTLINESS